MPERDCRLQYEYEEMTVRADHYGWDSQFCYWWCMDKMRKGRGWDNVRGMQKLAAEKSLAERESR